LRQPTIRQRKLNLFYGSWFEQVQLLRSRGLTLEEIAARFTRETEISVSVATLSGWIREIEHGERLAGAKVAA
jgi:hypothetical protein